MSNPDREDRKRAREEEARKLYEENSRLRGTSSERQSAERSAVLESHREHSGEYLYRIYWWVRFGGIVLVVLVVLFFIGILSAAAGA